jgi:hypothetical protein
MNIRRFSLTLIRCGGFAGLFHIWTIGALIASITGFINGNYLVGLVNASQSAANGISGLICILFLRRGYLPVIRRQTGRGFLFFFAAGFLGVVLSGFVIALLNLGKTQETGILRDHLRKRSHRGGSEGTGHTEASEINWPGLTWLFHWLPDPSCMYGNYCPPRDFRNIQYLVTTMVTCLSDGKQIACLSSRGRLGPLY